MDVAAGANEAAWSDALAVGLEGAEREVRMNGCRRPPTMSKHSRPSHRSASDWIPRSLAIPFYAWPRAKRLEHEGIGQVLHYRDDSGKQGVLVLILPDGYSDWVRLEKLERKRCKPYAIALIVLMRVQPPLTAGVKTQGREATSRSSSNPKGSPPARLQRNSYFDFTGRDNAKFTGLVDQRE